MSAKARPLDIAIVGMACRFPGARDVVAFWKNILDGRDVTRDVPPDRWDPSDFFDPGSKAKDRVYCQRGGFLDDPVEFDPAAYGIMPLVVEGGEPEQFLILDTAVAALVDAGIVPGPGLGSRVEVVIGRGNYFNRGNLTRLQHGRIVAQTLALLRELHPEWNKADFEAVRTSLKKSLPPFEGATIAGQVTNATAGVVANRLNLTGASYVVDAASASSLVALDHGARALRERRADVALVGGIYLAVDVDFTMVFTQLGALSRAGQARPFAKDADGTLPGEGVGMVVLKRRRDAERDGDRIYAVVQGIGLASDGRGTSLAAPRARGHVQAMRRAYRRSGIDPGTIGLIEGHGLGVPASDNAELRALRAVFPPSDGFPRKLGAVSSMIGHAMPAAGIAGLIKTALALHHRVLPPTLHADESHPLLDRMRSTVQLNRKTRPWIHGTPSQPRRACVNAFGFAGINAHAILEEHPASADGRTPGVMPHWETEAFLLGAPDRNAWIELGRVLVDWLERDPNQQVPLKDLAFTLNSGQPNFPFRVGIVAGSANELRDRLSGVIERLNQPGSRSIRDARGTYFWDEPLANPGALAFLYPGEGSQYPGMLADLCPHFPEVRALFDTADRLSRTQGHSHVPSEVLFGDTTDGNGALWSMEMAISLVLSSQWALHTLLSKLGLRPDAVLGHSSGEFLALAAAGAVEVDRQFEDRLSEMSTIFERLVQRQEVPEAELVAVATGRPRVEAACRELGGTLMIAMDNCPHQVVVAGTPREAATFMERMRAEGVLCESLPFSRAYHTPAFEGAVGPIRAFYETQPIAPPKVPIYSCALSGRMATEPDAVRAMAVEQWMRCVDFRSTIDAMYGDGVRVFVEVGTRGNLTSFVEDTLRGRPHLAIPANLPRRSSLTQLNHLVAALFAQGVRIQPDLLYARRRPVRIDLARDLAAPAIKPALKLGFPELRLEPEVVASLRERAQADSVLHSSPRETLPLGPARRHREPLTPPRCGDPLPKGERGVFAYDGARQDRNTSPLAGEVGPQRGPGEGYGRHLPFADRTIANDFEGTASVSPKHLNGSAESAFAPAGIRADGMTAIAADSPSREAAMLSYLKTMDAFLETQRQVLRAFQFGGGSVPSNGTNGSFHHVAESSNGVESGNGHAERYSTSGTTTPGHAAHVPAPLPGTTAPVTGPNEAKPSCSEALLEQVARRTGYPREMLDIDLDIEADLGIDSIKRVEILGELQARGFMPQGSDLDQVARCRTLRQVIELMEPANASPSTTACGPWVGTIEHLVPERELRATRWLDARTDPVAHHHTLGGRRVSALDLDRKGLPVLPFTVMAEMIAQAAAVLAPGHVLVGLREVEARRWIKYEEEPFALELRATRDPARPLEVHVGIHGKPGGSGTRRANADQPLVQGIALFGAQRAPAPPAPAWQLPEPRTCRFTAESVYAEQWLFHGPALQAITRMGEASHAGIEGTLRVLPRTGLFADGDASGLVTDPIVLDAFTQLLGAWGLDEYGDGQGDVIFPLKQGELVIYDADPGVGADVECRIYVRETMRHRIRVDADFVVGPEGRLWMQIKDWQDWRFYWPGRYRDHFRCPDGTLIGEPLELPTLPIEDSSRVLAVWLEPPADMTRPVWRDVLEWVQLGPDERLRFRGRKGPETTKTHRLFGRIAAKEAVRRLRNLQGEDPVYPADLEVVADSNGKPFIRSLLEPDRSDLPAISIAHTEGVALALATLDPGARVGIDVERIVEREEGFVEVAFTDDERRCLENVARDDCAEWIARFWCAKEAAAKSTGFGLLVGPASVVVVQADRETGVLTVSLGADLANACREWDERPVKVVTARRGETAWAWTLGERIG